MNGDVASRGQLAKGEWEARYRRAEALLPGRVAKDFANAAPRTVWTSEKTFWYRAEHPDGWRFRRVDLSTSEETAAFDHDAVAAAWPGLPPVSPSRLPVDSLTFDGHEGCELRAGRLRFKWLRGELRPLHPDWPVGESVSPDGLSSVFEDGGNLFIRNRADDSVRALTQDGQPLDGYAVSPDSNTFALGLGSPLPDGPPVLWSPDSRRLLLHRVDQRAVPELHLLQTAAEEGGRPRPYAYRYPFPGDPVARVSTLIVEVANGARVVVDRPPVGAPLVSPIEWGRAWWSPDGERIHLLEEDRGARSVRLVEVDTATGAARVILTECGSTYVDVGSDLAGPPCVAILHDAGEALWWSERDGWARLYLVDLTSGRVLRPVSPPGLAVREITHVDVVGRRVVFTASGEAPADAYLRRLYLVNLDGGEAKCLTPATSDHMVRAPVRSLWMRLEAGVAGLASTGVSPDGAYFVVSASRLGGTPSATVIDLEGNSICRLEPVVSPDGDIQPIAFTVKAADGVTDIFGALWRPPGRHAQASLPILDSIYPGPQQIRAPKRAEDAYRYGAAAFAALGFAVIALDGRGTPFRSKAFHDLSYGRLQDAGCLADHVAAIEQLSSQFPELDVARVGIVGQSAGGFAAVRALIDYPDVFKAGVAACGDHDCRLNIAYWAEKYQGVDADLQPLVNADRAAQITGRLLLAHGDMDDNVHPASTLQLANALIAANKDFEFLLLPNRRHDFTGSDGYFIRRVWDFFLRSLMQVEPPAYRIGIAESEA